MVFINILVQCLSILDLYKHKQSFFFFDFTMENDESSTKDADPENKVTKMKTFFNVNKKTNTKYVFFFTKDSSRTV